MKKIVLILLAMFVITPPRYLQAWDGEPSGSVISPSDYLAKGEASGGGVPVGTIAIWPDSQPIPPDWQECNGVGSYYDPVNEVYRNIPNYQGMFLRGFGNQSFTQNNGSIIGKTSTNYQSGTLGTIQGDSIREIQGTACGVWSHASISNSGDGAVEVEKQHRYALLTGSGNWHQIINFTTIASRVTPVSTEIRPINVAVKYIIKIR